MFGHRLQAHRRFHCRFSTRKTRVRSQVSVQGPSVQKVLLTSVAFQSRRVLVRAQVGLKTIPGGAPPLADVALVIFLACVYAPVRREGAGTSERLVALLTLVGRPLHGVRLAVSGEQLPGGVRRSARTASVHPVVRMKMPLEIALSCELPAAFGALAQLLSRVHSKVLCEFVFPTQRLAAHGARVGTTGGLTARLLCACGGLRS